MPSLLTLTCSEKRTSCLVTEICQSLLMVFVAPPHFSLPPCFDMSIFEVPQLVADIFFSWGFFVPQYQFLLMLKSLLSSCRESWRLARVFNQAPVR